MIIKTFCSINLEKKKKKKKGKEAVKIERVIKNVHK